MNIVMVTQIFFPDTIGGAGRYIHDLAVGLHSRGHRVAVLTPQVRRGPREERLEGLRIVRYGPLRSWWQVPGSLLAIRRLFRQLHREQPVDLVVIQQSLPGLPLLLDPRARRLRWVYHFQSPWAEESRIRRQVPWWGVIRQGGIWLRHLIERLVVRQARRCVTLSESMKAILLAAHRLPAEQVAVIPGCVDLARFQPTASQTAVRRELGLPLDRPILLTVRNLIPRMNLDGLIRAMRLVIQERPDTLLLIGGSGRLAASLQALIHSLGLEEHVRLLGRIPEDQLVPWYQAADLFVIPSRALEGFGLVTLEALACGTPVVGTPIGGTTELLTDLDPSLLCAGTEAQAIASAILGTLTRVSDPQVRQDLSARCRTFASRFSHQTMVETLEQTYHDVGRVRVLHVHTLPVVSGSGLNTLLSMQGQRDAGFSVELACAPSQASRTYLNQPSSPACAEVVGDLTALVEQAGMRVRAVHHLRRAISPWHDFWAILELWRLCRRERYTIVHTHNSKAGVVGRLAAWLAGVPVIVHTYHSCVFRYRHLRSWQQQVFLWAERLAAPLTTHFIAISEALREECLAVGLAQSDRIETIYSGIDLEEFQQGAGQDGARQQLGLSARDVVIGSVARLDVGKGHEELLNAFARLTPRFPQAKLICVGEGPLRSHLEEKIRRLNLNGRVILLGQRDDMPRLVHLFDIATLASHYEGMGRVLLEAQAAGKPVVATNAGGMVEIVKDGQTGYLVPVGDAGALAEALERLITDAALRARMGQAAVEWVSSRFSQQRMCEQLQVLYERLLRQCTRC